VIDRIIAVDLGGTQVRAALCDTQGKILKCAAQPAHAHEGPEAVFARIVMSICEIVDDWSRVRGIGLGAPGTLDPWRGVFLEAPNLPVTVRSLVKPA
jgi:glucokinase